MISLLTMIVVMMIAFTSNVGQLVTEKIALQNTADFAAYSGAATQAGVLNDIRRHNQRIWQAHKTARTYLQTSEFAPPIDFVTGGACPVCAVGPYMCPLKKTNVSYEAAITAAKAVVSIETPIIIGLNNTMGMRARSAAAQSVQQNYPGAQMSTKGGSLSKADLKQDDIDLDYYGWGFVSMPPPCPLNGLPVGSMQITHTTAKSWFFKNNNARGEVMFAVETKGTPATSFLGSDGGTYLGNYFGDRKELKAYAAALPIAGKVGTIKGGRFNKALENKWQGANDSYINDQQTGPYGHADKAGVLSDSEVVGNHYHDYKVRYVGIFESRAQFSNGTGLTSSFPSMGTVAH